MFFFRQKNTPDAIFSTLRGDMHSHLIPGIDDGAKDLDMSIRLVRGLQELGYKKLVTTHTSTETIFPTHRK